MNEEIISSDLGLNFNADEETVLVTNFGDILLNEQQAVKLATCIMNYYYGI